jgi:ABC-type sugar transport system ATPase subunit
MLFCCINLGGVLMMATLDNNEFLLEMRGISKEFPGVKALDEVNLKSTLLKCLFGIYEKNKGDIFFLGEKVNFQSSKQALEAGISMVHQELNQVLQRTVMDNIWLGRYPTKGLFIDQQKMYQDTKEIFSELDIDIDPQVKVATLSVSQMQMLEIAKAFSYNAKIVIMDEPTSSLTEKEVNHLFTIIQKLKNKGCGIVYISHKMDEIFAICDEITILRDGRWVDTQKLADLNMDQIIAKMVGRELTQRFPDKTNVPKETILSYSNLDITFNALVANVDNYTKWGGLLSYSQMSSDTQWVIDSMRVKTPSHKTKIGSLSGGNQQKVIIGRWLLTKPEILMLDEPTRGIDVGAKFEIYQLILDLANRDKGVIIISSEMPELLGITDRILVMSNGRAAGIVDTKTTTQHEILSLASRYL